MQNVHGGVRPEFAKDIGESVARPENLRKVSPFPFGHLEPLNSQLQQALEHLLDAHSKNLRLWLHSKFVTLACLFLPKCYRSIQRDINVCACCCGGGL
jgi:hypothetical protein